MIALITGSAGLIGSEAARFFSDQGFGIVGIDNDMRKEFFGDEASTAWQRQQLEQDLAEYVHKSIDIRDAECIGDVFSEYSSDIKVVIHSAAQPSHDWAAKDPVKDFSVNANGTLSLLEATRQFAPHAVFIFTSTNKVYGNRPNFLPLVEKETRWEIEETHEYYKEGIDERMSIDNTKHSLFGASKVAADVLVQEYGKYFGIKTGVFRGGCLTGPGHSGTALHGFLAYLMKCCITGDEYSVFGYKGKQVRDNMHSYDLVNMFWHFYQNPRKGEVYNAGGSRYSNCSMLEAIEACERITGNPMRHRYVDEERIGDHIWYISDVTKFKMHFPEWRYKYSISDIFVQLFEGIRSRSLRRARA